VWGDPKTGESEFVKFGWMMDCDGNRVELWESSQPKREKKKEGVTTAATTSFEGLK